MHQRSSMLGAALALASLVVASPMVNRPLNEGGLSPQACKAVDFIVQILELNKAAPFCSSFLGIQTSASATAVTVENSAQITLTGTATETTTSTVETTTLTSTDTDTVATLLTVVSTAVVPTVSLTTTAITPAEVTVTTTSYTSPEAAKRSALSDELEDRAIKLPPFVASFASSAVSSACSCLSIPTPVGTSTSTIQVTNTATVLTTESATDVVPATATTSITTTTDATLYIPTTTTATSLTVSTVTVFAAVPTVTVTQTAPFSPDCLNIIRDEKLYEGVVELDVGWSYEGGVYNVGGTFDETSLSNCCQLCQNTIGCNIYNLFVDQPNTHPGVYTCYNYHWGGDVGMGESDQCPQGRLIGFEPVAPTNDANGWGIGPCYTS